MESAADESQGWGDRLKGGDRQALARLFTRDRERLRRVVQFRLDPRLLGRLDADDVLQEAYLSAARQANHARGNSSTSLFLWLRLVTLRTLADLERRQLAQKRSVRREISLDDCPSPQTSAASMAAQLSGDFTSPSQAAVRAEAAEQLELALEQMDAIDREILALRHFEELTNSEVAEVLGIQQKAASIRYVRAIKRLRAVLSQLPGFADEEPIDG